MPVLRHECSKRSKMLHYNRQILPYFQRANNMAANRNACHKWEELLMKKEQTEMICNSQMESFEERRRKVQQFHMTSDIFFGKVLEDREACQEVARILLKDPGMIVREVKSQYSIRNIESHSVVLDIIAENMDGKMVNIEMQISGSGDPQKRVRYYAASIDMSFLEKGVPYDNLPDVYLIFITEKDFLKQKCGIYYIGRTIIGQEEMIDNGVHEVYANLTYTCSDQKINELLKYMKKSESSYKTDVFPNVVKKVKFLKEQREGVNMMCRIMEEERAEGKAEGEKLGIERYSQLIIKLTMDGRQDDIIKAASDTSVLQELYKEYQL